MKRLSAKAVVIAAFVIACVLVLAACSGQSSSSSSAGDTQSKPKIVVGYDQNNYGTGAGQGYTDSANYNSFVKSALDRLGWDAEFKGIDFADVEKSINDGTIDCFWDSYSIQSRDDMYAWSDPYRRARPVLVWKLANGTFDTTEGIAEISRLATRPSGMIIGVNAGTVTYADMPADQKAIIDAIGTFKEYPGLNQCKEALDKDEVDMVLTEAALTAPLFAEDAYPRVVFDHADTNYYGVAFKRGNEDKAKTLSNAMRDISADGTLKSNQLAYLKGVGIPESEAEVSWLYFYQDWLLKSKMVIGYDKNDFGEGQNYADSADYRNFVKSTVENLGWEAEFKGIDFADIEKFINDGTIDCFWDSYTIQGREDLFTWSEPYMKARPMLICRADNRLFGDVDNWVDASSLTTLPQGKTIATLAGSVTYEDMPIEQKAIIDAIGTLKEYPGYIQCKEALDKGEVDVVLTEKDLMTPLFASGALYSKVAFDASNTNSYGVAFKKGSDDRAKAVTEAMRAVYTSGTLRTNNVVYIKSLGLVDAATQQDVWKYYDQEWLLK